ncbi:MAG: hypothetical protein AB8B65_08615 [Kordia sp.]|uniref:hypothetical protein n=1 Tax=Kordia sp. TaxID=1965332 RepID=UPI00385DD7DF
MKSLKANNNIIRILVLLVFIGLLNSCSKQTFKNKKELQSYIQEKDNGYLQEKTINGVQFSLLYRPTDLLVAQELKTESNKEDIERLREHYQKYIYFNLFFSANDKELLSTVPKNRNEFGEMVNTLAFGMNEKVHLFTKSKDTIEMADYIYPRMYGMSNSTAIMLVYPRNKEQLEGKNLNLTVEDLGISTGEVKFKIPTQIINNELKLSFNF